MDTKAWELNRKMSSKKNNKTDLKAKDHAQKILIFHIYFVIFLEK